MRNSLVEELCQKYQILPLRQRGQNFLINKRVLERILGVAKLGKNDIILEIGAGFGTLTEELAKRAKKVVAIEIDKKLVEILRERLKDYKNIQIIQDDVLKLSVADFQINSKFKIVANLPYNITGAVLRKFLSEEKNKPNLMVLMVQKEVAERICAKPNKMSLLSVTVQFYGQPEIIQVVSRNNFWPKPKVDSAILRIVLFNKDKKFKLTREDEKKFFHLVKIGFSSPRKQLVNNLAKIIEKEKIKKIFQKINLNEKVRAQELSIKDWLALFNQIFKNEKK
jgi:16S rRNA (adenine1518-N6/adenine1519-N6)-dimethyltransferase